MTAPRDEPGPKGPDGVTDPRDGHPRPLDPPGDPGPDADPTPDRPPVQQGKHA